MNSHAASPTGESGHIPTELLGRYTSGDTGSGPSGAWWVVEAHLENCARCRDRLRDAVGHCSPATEALLDRVRDDLAAEVDRSPRMPARPHLWNRLPRGMWWAAPAMLQRLGMTVLVVAVALVLDLVDDAGSGRLPSLVLLVAPVAPLVGVAAVWSRGADPAHELVVSSPRAGLDLVLRRSLAVLAVVVPLLAVAGALVGMSPARWLLPCLAFTAGALALGERVGLHRAATGLALLWIAGVVTPSLVVARPPGLLATGSLPAWVAALVLVVTVLVVRRRTYTCLPSSR